MELLLLPFLLIDEYLTIIWYHCYYLFHPQPPIHWKEGNTGRVVVLPGFGEQWVFFKNIGNFLNKLGYQIVVVPYNTSKPTSNCCQFTKDFLKSNSLKNVVIVTHSKGGLIALSLLQDPTITRCIKRVITIAAPYKGTWVGLLLPAVWELIPPRMRNLNIKSNLNLISNIYPLIDNHIFPHCSLELPKGINFPLNVIGHTRILKASETTAIIQKILEG